MAISAPAQRHEATATVSLAPPPGMTGKELQSVMAANVHWQWPAHDDGWVHAHNAIRMDLVDIAAVIDALAAHVKAGKPLQQWQLDNLRTYWTFTTDMIHHHHDNEEHIFFPFLAQTITLPHKVSADHVTLLRDMDAVSACVRGLSASRPLAVQQADLEALRTCFSGLKAMMEEHLAEEEQLVLPLVRKHFGAKQIKPVEEKIVKQMSPEALGWYLRHFADDADRKRWMTHVAGIPGFVQWLVMMPNYRKFMRRKVRLLEEVKTGQQIKNKNWYKK